VGYSIQKEPSINIIVFWHISCTSPFESLVFDFVGSNGQEYQFLLKGHEDLRQDERVMQLFGLVNSLLLNNPETFRRNLT